MEEALADLSIGIDYIDSAIRRLAKLGQLPQNLQEYRDKILDLFLELEDKQWEPS